MEIVFKEATTSDIRLLIPLVEAFYSLEKISFDKKMIETALEQLLTHDQYGRAWLIYEGEHLIGYVIFTFGFCLEFGGRDAFIDEIYLIESARNRGFGKKIIDFLADYGRNTGIKVILLEVDHGNVAAQEVYKKRGFIPREKYFLMTKYL
jgi:ribosomal protein S18 acetylase RimI-like enzyme